MTIKRSDIVGNINVTINGTKHEYKSGIKLEDISNDFQSSKKNIVLALVNNEVKELTSIIEDNCEIKFLDLKTTNGQKVYKRSLSFLFIKAMHDVLNEAKVELCHTLSKGQYCLISNTIRFNKDIVKKINEKMIEIVNMDMPFTKNRLSRKEAIELFKKINREDKVSLFKNIDKDFVNIYELDGYRDYFYGYLVPSTRYLKNFSLVYENDGVVLMLPRKENPDELEKYRYQPKLLKVFQETKDWSKIMGVHLVGDLNELIAKEEYPELIRTVEALHETKIAKIAEIIANHPTKRRVILIAGPSSSGKTSFSKRLAIQLKVNGLKPVAISLDDYFVEREKTPIDEHGEYDFESINSLDMKLFNEDLNKLLKGEEVELPFYNFKRGKREYNGHKLRIDKDQPLILEGIHGLNPLLTSTIPDEIKFKIYVSPLTQLNLDNHNRISTTDSRLLRRIVRDNQFRGHGAQNTIKMWESVRRGEEKNIFPYQEEADAMFNSTLIYEISVLKKYAVPLLSTITKNEEGYIEANRLLKFIQYFKTIDEELDIPSTSILREFIGGSRIA